MQLVRVAALVGAAVLGGCSGGGSSGNGGGGTVVTPTPSPSTGVTPTPSPSPSYTKFADLTGDLSFPTTCTSITISSPVIARPATLPDEGLAIRYSAAAQSWTVTGDGIDLTFVPSERDTSAPATSMAYVKPGSPTTRFSVSPTGPSTALTEYLRNVTLTHMGHIYSCVTGVKTVVTDRPPASQIAFPTVRAGGYLFRTPVFGSVSTQYNLEATVSTYNVDLATGKVTFTIRLTVTPFPVGSASEVDLGTVTAVADIDSATGAFYGTTVTSPDFTTIMYGQFSGRFFGPQGKESGFVLSMFAERADGFRYSVSFRGAALR